MTASLGQGKNKIKWSKTKPFGLSHLRRSKGQLHWVLDLCLVKAPWRKISEQDCNLHFFFIKKLPLWNHSQWSRDRKNCSAFKDKNSLGRPYANLCLSSSRRWFENEVLTVQFIIKAKSPETMLTPSFRLLQKETIAPDPDMQMDDCLPRQIPVYQSRAGTRFPSPASLVSNVHASAQ